MSHGAEVVPPPKHHLDHETLFVKEKEGQYPAKLKFVDYNRQELVKKFTMNDRNIDIEALKR